MATTHVELALWKERPAISRRRHDRPPTTTTGDDGVSSFLRPLAQRPGTKPLKARHDGEGEQGMRMNTDTDIGTDGGDVNEGALLFMSGVEARRQRLGGM